MNSSYLERLGVPGVVGVGLLLFCLAFYLGSIFPAQNELTGLKFEEEQLLAAYPSYIPRVAATDAEGRQIGVEPITAITAFPDLLKELNALAEPRGVMIERASYSLSEQGGQRRMEINLPLRASYPALRAYLRDVMALKIAPALAELALKRQQSSDSTVEAVVRLSYLVAPVP